MKEKSIVFRFGAGLFLLFIVSAFASAQSNPVPDKSKTTMTSASSGSNDFGDFPVLEFRRYTIKDGERQHFQQHFDAYFPQAIQQTGAIVAGEFLERDHTSGFTWIRAFHTMDDRAKGNANLYYGPVWKEHKATMNDLLTDSDNVMLLRPVIPERGVTILRSVDAVKETTEPRGVVVAQIFAVKPDSVDAFTKKADAIFASYRAAGVREAGLLVTLDARNNFPQLPVRTDGPFVVWLGVVKDDEMLQHQFKPLVEPAVQSLTGTGLLRSAPELIVMDPTGVSRLRWLPEWQREESGNRSSSR